MKFRYAIAVSTICLLLGAPALAAEASATTSTATGEPVALQPMPLPPSVATAPVPPVAAPVQEMRATLGPEGLMYTMQRQGITDTADAAAIAAIAPASGGAIAAPLNTDKPARTIGGAQVLPARAIAENITGPGNLTTLVKALNAAQLESSLATPGPYTLFAPSNNAFNKLPKASFDTLLAPSGRDRLTKLLNYHIVPGQHDAASIRADIAANGGSATYATLAGESLKVTSGKNGAITVIDENGNKSRVALADAYQSNGVMHIVDTVLIPQ